jgi:hypothetical protein
MVGATRPSPPERSCGLHGIMQDQPGTSGPPKHAHSRNSLSLGRLAVCTEEGTRVALRRATTETVFHRGPR